MPSYLTTIKALELSLLSCIAPPPREGARITMTDVAIRRRSHETYRKQNLFEFLKTVRVTPTSYALVAFMQNASAWLRCKLLGHTPPAMYQQLHYDKKHFPARIARGYYSHDGPVAVISELPELPGTSFHRRYTTSPLVICRSIVPTRVTSAFAWRWRSVQGRTGRKEGPSNTPPPA